MGAHPCGLEGERRARRASRRLAFLTSDGLHLPLQGAKTRDLSVELRASPARGNEPTDEAMEDRMRIQEMPCAARGLTLPKA